jgi:hypothetical protein
VGNPTPIFEEGYDLNVEEIPGPDVDLGAAELLAQAESTGSVAEEITGGGGQPYYVVDLGQPGPGQMTYRAFESDGDPADVPVVVDLATTAGVFWFDDNVRVSGVLEGQLTIAARGWIRLTADITYQDSTPGSGPNPDCTDVLGLVAFSGGGPLSGQILIEDTPENTSDGIEIHGVLLADDKVVGEDYQFVDPIVDLVLYGGCIATNGIHLATENGSSGYERHYHYDYRALFLPPPFFPYAHNFTIIIWEENEPQKSIT